MPEGFPSELGPAEKDIQGLRLSEVDAPLPYPEKDGYEILRIGWDAEDAKNAGRIAEEEYRGIILKINDVQQAADGDFYLYHAVPADKFVKVLQDGALRPAIETGERSWRTIVEENSDEEHDINKKSNVYLASRRSIKSIARKLNQQFGTGVYVLKVKVPEEGLIPDEDSNQNSWVDSLAYSSTCAYSGRINSFRPVGRMESLGLSLNLREEMASEAAEAAEAGNTELRDTLLEEYLVERNKAREAEGKILEKAGLRVSSIPVLKDQ